MTAFDFDYQKKANAAMLNFLERRILKDGVTKAGNILKVGSFLNHQIDIDILRSIGMEFKNRFIGSNITKVLTVEASGIALAVGTAMCFDVPVLFAKKTQSSNVDGEKYIADAYSYTHNCLNHIFVDKSYLKSDDRILIVDDFLANGAAVLAMAELVRQAGATVVGVGIAIEKGFQDGGNKIREQGYRVESIAIIDYMDPVTGNITFRER